MANITVQQYQPSEIIAIFNDILAQQNNKASGKIVCIRGLFLKGNGVAYNGVYYDSLRDENSPVELPIRITEAQRKELTAGNLVDILGTLGRRITSKSEIKLELNVSRVEIVKEQVIDENEVKRIEYRQRKVEKGFHNVDAVLESLLFAETRPQIALVLAATTKTKGDFEDGIRAARASIDFYEEPVTFTQTKVLCAKLKELDAKGFHAIAIVRGGGIDPNTDVDKPEVIETVVGLKTPFISGVGHQPEKIFLRQVADKWTPTPQGLGQYFSELVETVTEKRNKSQAALTEQIKKQYQKQINDSNKKNKELLEQVTKLNKQAEEQRKANAENLKKLNEENAKNLQKQQEENKKNLEAQQKKNDEALAKIQAQSKQQQEASIKQNAALQKQIENLTKSNKETFDKMMAQNKEALDKEQQRSRDLERQLEEARNKKGCAGGCLGMIVAIISIASLACWMVCLVL